jgi:uncharacterized protein (TIGR02246 family)
MSRIAILAVCFGLAAVPAYAQDQAAAQNLVDAWAAAFNKGDAKAIAALYTADAYVLPDHAAMAHGRAAIEKMVKQLTADGNYQNDLKLAVLGVRQIDPNAASQLGTYTITVKGPQPHQEIGKFASVLRKVGGKWLIQTDIWNADK